ncbi:MAG: purine-binding chemotaxis protein CheW [Anaerolineae bacterium]|nr:purine-binding chemotaxis protein CheW [Gemmatimonadaceae bacterium]
MDSTVLTTEEALRELVLFRLGERTHAIDLHDIREIIPRRRATRIPGAPRDVAGIINVRGTIVTVIDLGARLAGELASADGSVILVQHGQKLVGIAVDEVCKVLRLPPADIDPVQADAARIAGLSSEHGGVVTGLGHSGDSIVIILDIHTIITHVLL